MMKSKFLILLCALSSTLMIAQEKLADKFFSNYNYVKATELYEEVLKKDDTSLHVLTRLGDCYYNNSKSEKAAYWYGKALDKYGEDKINPEYIYKYIQSLRSLGEYSEADQWMTTFMAIQNDDSRAKDYNPENIAKYNELAKTESDKVVQLINLPINSKYSDFGTFVHNDIIYFASSRNTDNEIYKWNNEPYLDIYQSDITTEDGSKRYTNVSPVNFDLNDRDDVHDANVTITNDGKTMYFTRDNVNKRNKKVFDKKGTTHLKIYKATWKDNAWTNVIELPFNDDVFSTGHPALGPDNKQLYFVSDREGGLGYTDIYVVDILGDNEYSEPRNLGDNINTEGREMFPFVAKDSTFYFSSDGHFNLGLLDIFKSDIIKDKTAQPINLGAPYNSGYDDFAYFKNDTENSNEQSGYFSSNRPDGQGSDDIYSFEASQCIQTIKGIARDKKTNAILAGVVVQLINEVGKVITEVETNADGSYEFIADCNSSYTILGTKKDYKDDQQKVSTNDINDTVTEVDLYLEPLINDTQIVINPIFFDFDKWNIRTDAQYELENIVDVMRAHPTMVIKIESHTDSRGRDAYNMKLSDRRAKSTMNYIISRGIDPDRIESAIGYGESQLLNKCSNGVKCTEEEHQLNRRSYFYILKQ